MRVLIADNDFNHNMHLAQVLEAWDELVAWVEGNGTQKR